MDNSTPNAIENVQAILANYRIVNTRLKEDNSMLIDALKSLIKEYEIVCKEVFTSKGLNANMHFKIFESDTNTAIYKAKATIKKATN